MTAYSIPELQLMLTAAESRSSRRLRSQKRATDRVKELEAEVATLEAIIAGCPRCTQRATLRAEDL